MDLKMREIDGKSSQKEVAWGVPRCCGGSPQAPGPRASPFLTTFTVNILRFEVHFSGSVWVLRKDSMDYELI